MNAAPAPRLRREGSVRWPVLVSSALVATASIAFLLWWSAAGPKRERGSVAPPAAPASVVGPATPRSPAPVGELAVASGQTLEIEARALPQDAPLVLTLQLPAEAHRGEPLPVRVLAPDGRQLETTGSIVPDAGGGARLELEPGWLRPGRYLVEVKTADRSHLPLRRYAILVR